MPLAGNDRDAIHAAIGASVEPVFARDTLTLQLATKRIVLARPNGCKTLAGGFYEQTTMRPLPRALLQGAPIRQGNSEFLMLRGKKRRLRTWNAGENSFDYTSWGIQYYQNRRVEAVVSVPVRISGANATTGRQ